MAAGHTTNRGDRWTPPVLAPHPQVAGPLKPCAYSRPQPKRALSLSASNYGTPPAALQKPALQRSGSSSWPALRSGSSSSRESRPTPPPTFHALSHRLLAHALCCRTVFLLWPWLLTPPLQYILRAGAHRRRLRPPRPARRRRQAFGQWSRRSPIDSTASGQVHRSVRGS